MVSFKKAMGEMGLGVAFLPTNHWDLTQKIIDK